MADNAPPAPAADASTGARGLRALAPALRQVQWPHKFKPEMPPRYNGAADPLAFLLAYEEAVLKAGGDDKVMANWFPMALAGAPRAWLLNLPGSSVASWEELRDLFIARFAAPVPLAVAALLGGSQAPPSDRHTKQFFRQIGAASVQQGAPPGWAAPKADLTFDSGDHPTTTAGACALPMLYTSTICNVAVTKTLINGGAGLNVLSVEAFSLLHVPHGRLRPTKPFSRVMDGSTCRFGKICLPVTFGTRENYRSELIDFNIARIGLPYNTILGYPALAQFMVATHPAYNLIKMTGSNG